MQSKKSSGVRRDVEADLRLGRDVLQLGPERLRLDDDAAVVAGLDPALVAHEPDRAGAQLGDPALGRSPNGVFRKSRTSFTPLA